MRRAAGLSCSDFADQDYGDCDQDWDDLGNCLSDNCDGGNTYDNVGACQDLEDSMNALDCLTTDFDYSCDSYDGVDCDYTDYFDCMADVYSCDGDTLVYDTDDIQTCTDIADEISSTC
jgi:hypothetical protein